MSQKIECPHCGKKTPAQEAKFDGWNYAYEWSECVWCNRDIVYDGETIWKYTEYFEKVQEEND